LDADTLRRIGGGEAADLGRFEVTSRTADTRAFRTQTLRNVALTAPYMHDGSLATLDAVLDHYVHGGTPSDPAQDPRIRPFALDARDRAALLAFLDALTSPAAQAFGCAPAGSVGCAALPRRRRPRRGCEENGGRGASSRRRGPEGRPAESRGEIAPTDEHRWRVGAGPWPWRT
jgi:hypothetical protein